MKKLFYSILMAVGLLAATGYGQTNLPPVGGNTNFWDNLFGTLTAGTNWIVAPHYIYSIDKHRSGAGLALVAKLSDNVATAVGFDYLGPDGIWMPSATLQLNAPALTLGKLKTVFFGYTGVATPLSSGDKDWTAVAIAGTGANFYFTRNVAAFGAWEYRSADWGQYIRAGIDITF